MASPASLERHRSTARGTMRQVKSGAENEPQRYELDLFAMSYHCMQCMNNTRSVVYSQLQIKQSTSHISGSTVA